MAVTTSQAGPALDALVTLLTSALTTTVVVDGPPMKNDGETNIAQRRLFVGADTADPSDEAVAVEFDQSFRSDGARNRDEDFTVWCVAEGWSGETVMQTARNNAKTVLSGVESALRATQAAPAAPALGLSGVMYSELVSGTWTQAQTDRGAYCRIRFGVRVRAFLNQT